MVGPSRRFALADTAQQIVGGFLLAGPFVVTEEVWVLAASMTVWHALGTVAIVASIGYGALYLADAGRDPDREAEVSGVPVRFLSLMAVSYGSVLTLALVSFRPAAPAVILFGVPFAQEFALRVLSESVAALGGPATVSLELLPTYSTPEERSSPGPPSTW